MPAANSERACNDSVRFATAGLNPTQAGAARTHRAPLAERGDAVCSSGRIGTRDGETVTTTAHRLDRFEAVVRIELASQTTDEHFENVRVAIKILLIDVLGKVGLGDELTCMQHQVFE